MELFSGCTDHNAGDRCHSLKDLFLEVVHAIDMSLVDPIFDISPQKSPEV